ncbi:RICIN domain-containing protein [Streptomyces sp. NPDC048442]|uniref:RICIN domain-containing protein n=1 Tax=Streptomyces sp. NPDC048442 TaxID=3154823 RepID=UPI0034261F4A
MSARKAIGSVLASVAIAGTSLMVLSAPAHAAAPPATSTETLKNSALGKCLDADFTDSVTTAPCNGGNYQKWYVSGTDSRQIRNVATGQCLTTGSDSNVYTRTCNGTSIQRWNIKANFHLQNVTTGRYLDANAGGSVYTSSWNDGNYQVWW